MDAPRNEVHITIGPVGHRMSTDCWCEPNRIYWHTNIHGVVMLVVEHNDETPAHHNTVLAARDLDLDSVSDGDADAPWVSRALNLLGQPEVRVVHIPRKENSK
jgi:hypothetical protein